MENYNNYRRGSEWRKWDLHIHTPSSICQNYGGDNWDKFIESLERLPEDVKVIGINDYYFLDGYKKVMDYKKQGRLRNIEKVFPIVEFRIDTFGSSSENKLQKINLHIVFDVNESDLEKDLSKITKEFIEQIPITKLDKHKTKCLSRENFIAEGGDLQTGFDNLIPSTDKVFELLASDTWKHKTFLLLGYKEWSNLDKNNQLKPFKEDLYSKVSAFFTSNSQNLINNKVWLNEFGNKALLHSCDLHDFTNLDTANKDEDGNYLTSEKYHCYTWIKADPTFQGLKQILFEPEGRVLIQASGPDAKSSYQVIDRIEISSKLKYNSQIVFNSYLNSIIGGRSTGKSVLLGAIAKKLKTERPIELSNPDYNKFVQEAADSIKVIWKDNSQENNREIEYFKQGYMHDLARDDDKLSSLIENILNQKGKELILNSYNKSVAENSKYISGLLNDLFQILKDISEKKQKVKDKGDKKGVEDEIEKLTKELKALNVTEITDRETKVYEEEKENISKGNQIKQALANDIQLIEALKKISLLKENITYELTSISDEGKVLVEGVFNQIKSEVAQKWQTELEIIIQTIKQKEEANERLLNTASSNQTYIKVSKAYSDNVLLADYEQRIQMQKNKLHEINLLLEEVASLNRQYNVLKENIKSSHQSFFTKITEVIPQLSDTKDGLEIKAKPKFNNEQYRSILGSGINQKSYENQKLVDFNYSTNENYETHVFDLTKTIINNELTLKGGYTNQSLINAILSTNFYSITYDIEYEGDDFKKMSDGKKAFVVLKLLLDFSNKECPILIDQPEDDLDNRAIYNDLVQYLRKKKIQRQIILATHNPNIVVGADSELVICANQNGEKNANREGKKFQYVMGSLEHTFEKNEKILEVLEGQGIREHVCDILEGGDIAFKLREKKYSIK
jgi:predicted ATPase